MWIESSRRADRVWAWWVLVVVGLGLLPGPLLAGSPVRVPPSSRGSVQVRVVLAVVELRNQAAKVQSGEVDFLTDALRRATVEALDPQGYSVLTRETMDVLLPPEERRACLSGVCLAEVGRLLQARYVLGGVLRDFDGQLALTLECYETRNGALVNSSQAVTSSISQLVSEVGRMTPAILGRLGTSSGGSATPGETGPGAAKVGPGAEKEVAASTGADLSGETHAGPAKATAMGKEAPSAGSAPSPAGTPGVTASGATHANPAKAVETTRSGVPLVPPRDDEQLSQLEKRASGGRGSVGRQRWRLWWSGGMALAGLGGLGGSYFTHRQADVAYASYLELPIGSEQASFDARYGVARKWDAVTYTSIVLGSILLAGGLTFYFGG